jgi:ABC-type multidrug transport system ATPase subunit
MEEAERLCNRIAIMENGKILAVGSPQELIQTRIGVEVVELEVPDRDIPYYLARLKERNYRFQVVGRSLHVYLNPGQTNQDVLSLIFSKHVHSRAPNLNDVFLSLGGHDLQAPGSFGKSELRKGELTRGLE